MPLTFAHPAAVIPLRRWLGRVAVPSALVIGSVMPDSPYFLRFSMSRATSHSVPALFWYCVPVGLAVYLIFHLVLKLPLISLMPPALADRLATIVDAPRRLPQVRWWSVLLSLLIGAITHLAWDAFTHGGGAAVRAFDFFRSDLFSIGDYHMLVFRLLQHVSTVLGMGAIAMWIWTWMRRTPALRRCAISLPRNARLICIGLIVAVTAVMATWAGLTDLSGHHLTVSSFQDALGEAIITGTTTLGATVIVYSVMWNLKELIRR
jgi:uncharacterized membrane protein YidH (DUF202 family)